MEGLVNGVEGLQMEEQPYKVEMSNYAGRHILTTRKMSYRAGTREWRLINFVETEVR